MKTNLFKTASLAAALTVSAAVFAPGKLPLASTNVSATEIAATVNDEVVTTYDIARRTAFLRLQRQSGNLRAKATDELIEEALKRDAMRRTGIRIPDSMVDRAFNNFASGNNLSTGQLTQVLNQSGVTAAHFREFIRTQIGWGQTVQARSPGSNRMLSEQEVVAKMLEQGGQKPTSTEYLLQQVVFVVPQNQRSQRMRTRRTEATNMRSRVNGCDNLVPLARELRDVTVRDLGRVLELELPREWAQDVSGLQGGETTRVKDTERGVEFLVVCRARSVSDDRVAQLEFSTQALEDDGGDQGAKLLEELREQARIRRR